MTTPEDLTTNSKSESAQRGMADANQDAKTSVSGVSKEQRNEEPVGQVNEPTRFSRLLNPTLSKISRLIELAVVAGSLLSIALFVLSFLGRYSFIAELFGNFRFQIMLMLIAFAVAAACFGKKKLSAIAALGAAWSLVGILSIFVPSSNPPPGPTSLRLMSFNVLASNFSSIDVVDQIREVDPDVLVVLEYARNWHMILDCLNDEYPHAIRIPRWHGFGVAVFSKYPLSETTVHQLTENTTDNPMVVTNVNFGDQKIRLAAIHVVSPTSKFRMQVRNEQFLEAAELMTESDVPTVIMGDFNCVPWSSYLREFAQTTGYRETRQGFGIQMTWPNHRKWMGIPIDHAFVSDDIHVHDRIRCEPTSSDHRAIYLEVSTARKKDVSASSTE
jgi:endonuclease/exonuclease/phosphatase (EEP) superfamily protein YafD